MAITIDDLKYINNVFSLKVILEVAGLKYSTINSKMYRGTQLDVDESKAISEAIESLGIKIDMKKLSKFERKEENDFGMLFGITGFMLGGIRFILIGIILI